MILVVKVALLASRITSLARLATLAVMLPRWRLLLELISSMIQSSP